ncbi:MAG: permease [Acidobacteriota bacterium]
MTLLIGSILALLVGPLVYLAFQRRGAMLALLDGLIFVTITGLVLLFILPDSFDNGGWLTLPVAVAGLFGPTFLEGVSRQIAKRTHIAALVLGLTALILHALIDGTALSQGGAVSGSLLPLAVVIHRLPVGLTIWWLLRPSFGTRTAGAVLGMIAAATIIGFTFGPWLIGGLSSQGMAWFQAFVAGSLLHVVFHQPHLTGSKCGCDEVTAHSGRHEGAGALLGIGLIVVLLAEGALHHAHGPASATEVVHSGLQVFLVLALESAPALLIAYFMAGALHAFLPHSTIRWLRRGSSLNQAFRGMAVGLPFPVCSCGVVPLYQSLIRKGAPATAAMAFLIATPELGLDAVLLSVPLLGTELTVIRVCGAALVAALVGWIIGGPRVASASTMPVMPDPQDGDSGQPGKSFAGKARSALSVGLLEVVDHTAPWILLGIGIASVVQPLLTGGWLSRLPGGLDVPLFTLIGLPTYVCASGATPLVVVLIAGGVSPGAALAFLLTGPATNTTTFGMLGKLHGRRVAVLFSLTIIGLSIALGYLVNALFPASGHQVLNPEAAGSPSLLQVVSLVLLAAVYSYSILRRGARRFVAELFFRNQRTLDLHPHYH